MAKGPRKQSLSAGSNRLPKPIFRSIKDLDRVRNYMLGLPVEKKGATIPFGYKISEVNPSMLEPIESDFKLLIEAIGLLKKYSFRKVSRWLEVNSGRSITDAGLHLIMERRQPASEIYVDGSLLPREERERL